jgi:hypothetical protein
MRPTLSLKFNIHIPGYSCGGSHSVQRVRRSDSEAAWLIGFTRSLVIVCACPNARFGALVGLSFWAHSPPVGLLFTSRRSQLHTLIQNAPKHGVESVTSSAIPLRAECGQARKVRFSGLRGNASHGQKPEGYFAHPPTVRPPSISLMAIENP